MANENTQERVTPDVQFERQRLCNKCDHKKFDVCAKLQKLLPEVIHLKATKCPVNRWGRY
jgi:hypothetical protein